MEDITGMLRMQQPLEDVVAELQTLQLLHLDQERRVEMEVVSRIVAVLLATLVLEVVV